MPNKPHIVLVVPRGEAVRNFVYSDTLRLLNENARVTLLSVLDDERILVHFKSLAAEVIHLNSYPERFLVSNFRFLIHMAHFRWLWSEVAKNLWEILDERASIPIAKIRRRLWKGLVYILANRPALETLSLIEKYISWLLRPTDEFIELFKALKPDLVFNCSHIHGPAGDQPLRTAYYLGLPTAGFIFSWDNLTSRSRIFVPYDYYLVWNQKMRSQLLSIYPAIKPDHVTITGTPQFDFHFKPEFRLTREELCRRIRADPGRPIILYTTGIAKHFPEEHLTVKLVANLLRDLDIQPRPQLVVRTYIKDTSPEMKALASRNMPGVVFPPVLWDKRSLTPLYDDLAIYSSLLYHSCLGINAASTVSLELLMHDKPVINLGFDPPGSSLPHGYRYLRHIEFDHYRPVAESGAVMVARSEMDMAQMLRRGLTEPKAESKKRALFIKNMFDDTLDGNSGKRVAEELLRLAEKKKTLNA